MTITEFRDALFARLLEYTNPNNVFVKWPDQNNQLPNDVTWIRPTINHNSGGQHSLGGPDGQKRWKRSGFVIIQVFSPVAQGRDDGYRVAQDLVNLLQSWKHGCIWFRNIAFMEAGADGAFTQTNVSAIFQYDDIG